MGTYVPFDLSRPQCQIVITRVHICRPGRAHEPRQLTGWPLLGSLGRRLAVIGAAEFAIDFVDAIRRPPDRSGRGAGKSLTYPNEQVVVDEGSPAQTCEPSSGGARKSSLAD